MSYTIIRDTREQQGWFFPEYQQCVGTEVGTLKTGDYAIKEFPDLLCIERKSSVPEIATNVVREKDRFLRELERMRPYTYKYIICEFSMDDLMNYPENLKIAEDKKKAIKTNGKFLIRTLLEMQMEYNFQLLFCGNSRNAFITAASIMKRVYEKHSE